MAIAEDNRSARSLTSAETGVALPLDPLLGLKLRDQLAVEDGSDFYERLTGKVNLDELEPHRLIFGGYTWSTRLYQRARRLIDIVLGALGLVCSTPLMRNAPPSTAKP